MTFTKQRVMHDLKRLLSQMEAHAFTEGRTFPERSRITAKAKAHTETLLEDQLTMIENALPDDIKAD